MRLMVLGGGSCQKNLIKRAKQKGHFVIVADYLDSPPAKELADVHAKVSTFDVPGVIAAAKEHKIDGITTLGTDQPVFTAAAAAEELGFKFYADKDLALAVTNKRIMKEQFEEHSIPMNDYRLIGEGFSDEEIKGLAFQAVLKPVDSQGQRGIFLVNSPMEARQHVAETLSFSREKKVLLEQFYRADEITVNGWIDVGKTYIMSVVDRVTMKDTQHIGIAVCHNYPSVHLSQYGSQIKKLTEKIVSAFGIRNGPVYFQFLIGELGIKVNEIAMRIGGAYEDITLPMICGIDVDDMLLEYAEHGNCGTSALKKSAENTDQKFISTQMFFLKPGYIKYITPIEEVLGFKGVRAADYSVAEGETAGSIDNATARAGYIIVEGESFEDMINNVNLCFEKLKVLDENGENLVIKYSEYKDKYFFL